MQGGVSRCSSRRPLGHSAAPQWKTPRPGTASAALEDAREPRAPGRARGARRQRLRRRRWRGAHVQRERRRGGRRVSAPERARAPHAAAGAARTQRRRQRRVQVASGQVDQLHQPPERRVQLLWGSRCAAVRLPHTACLAWQVWSACVASAANARCWPAGSHRALTLQQAGSQHTGGCPKRVWGSRASRPP